MSAAAPATTLARHITAPGNLRPSGAPPWRGRQAASLATTDHEESDMGTDPQKRHLGTFAEGEETPPEDTHAGTFAEGEETLPEDTHAGTFAEGEETLPEDAHAGTFAEGEETLREDSGERDARTSG